MFKGLISFFVVVKMVRSSEESESESVSRSESDEEFDSDNEEESGEESEEEGSEEEECEKKPIKFGKRGRGYVENDDDEAFVASDDEVEFFQASHLDQRNVLNEQRLRKKPAVFTILHDAQADREALEEVDDCHGDPDADPNDPDAELGPMDHELDNFKEGLHRFKQTRRLDVFFAIARWQNFVHVVQHNAGNQLNTSNVSDQHFDKLVEALVEERNPQFRPVKGEKLVCYFCCLPRMCTFRWTIPNREGGVTHHMVGCDCHEVAEAILHFVDFLLELGKKEEINITRSDYVQADRLCTDIMVAQEAKANKY